MLPCFIPDGISRIFDILTCTLDGVAAGQATGSDGALHGTVIFQDCPAADEADSRYQALHDP